ncbi:uncharacterized protein LOC111122905 [Crassostrea virginica]
MSKISQLVVLWFLTTSAYSKRFGESNLKEDGSNVVTHSYRTETTYHERCGIWNFWGKCTRHKEVVKYYLKCAHGYSTYRGDEYGCTHACQEIPHCLENQCTRPENNRCVKCDGEVKNETNWAAYTSRPSYGKLCEMMEFAKITESMSSLRSGKTKVCDNPNDPSEVNSTEVIWTNEIQWKTVEAKWNSISVTWGGWTDDLSGLWKFEYEIFEVKGITLNEQIFITEGTMYLTTSLISINFEDPGLYAVHLTALDKAKNQKSSRRLVLYDNISRVSYLPNKVTRIETASASTNYTWVSEDTNIIRAKWTGRFRNIRHDSNRWLTKVSPYRGIEDLYDDHHGKRTIDEVPNISGCVDFLVSYNVNDGRTVTDFRDFQSVQNIREEEYLNLVWSDGDRADITVRAVDIFDKTLDDTVTVYRDATPPIIENLWLTRGDRLNISVHSLEDFAKMTIEWIAYDLHSGLRSIYWKLYDNFTGEEIVHGHEDIPSQGGAKNLTECLQKYSRYSRGANCYETNHWGSYHQHFQVQPQIKTHGGLVQGKDHGLHDSDYYIEVQTINNALLTTTIRKKITIDTSPPHTGIVQDGIRGTPEVDFQQSTTLHIHWDGFFDRESGVLFYQYGFHTEPMSSSDFKLNSVNPEIKETYSTEIVHTVKSEGTYYACVVACNRALEASTPVCSDGVMITTTVPRVNQVAISGAFVKGGLISNAEKSSIWLLEHNRYRKLIKNPSSDCVNKATATTDLEMFPILYQRNGSYVEVPGNVICSNTSGVPSVLSPILSKASHITMTWSSNNVSVHDYEVGFSSTSNSSAPDIMAFRSTKQHQRLHIMHSDLPEGTPFYIVIKTISKANVEGIQTIGPCYVDITGPTFTPPIRVIHFNGHLVASWASDAFEDTEDPYTLSFEYAIGHHPYGAEVHKYSELRSGDSCKLTDPPTCTAINISIVEWGLHGNHTYYVTIKAENVAGLATYGVSEAYVHNVQLPAEGIVHDTEDIEDIDYTTSTTSLSAHWTGFFHVYLDVDFRFRAGTRPGGGDVFPETDVGKNQTFTATGLTLDNFKTYFVTITAVSSAGNVEVTSDGVTVVEENSPLTGVVIFDGEQCDHKDVFENVTFSHHELDHRLLCTEDIDYQSSIDTLSAHWNIPSYLQKITPDMHISIEERSPRNNSWMVFKDFFYNHGHQEVKFTNLVLNPGFKYRFVVKLCAKHICYKPQYSNGVRVLANPPTTGRIEVKHVNTTGDQEKLVVNMDRLFDPDVHDFNVKYSVVDIYEWAITDQSKIGRTHTKWLQLTNFTLSLSGTEMSFTITLNGQFDFSKCRGLAIRGFNKIKMYSTVYSHIKDCNAFDPVFIKPKTVIDAVGKPDPDRDGYGEPIILETNAHWSLPDADYTPNMNYISAVWPQLRYKSYKVAVLNAKSVDVTTYYLPTNKLSLSDPCSHPDAIKCTSTDNEFINVKFEKGELEHGQRYMVCIHSEHTEIVYEKWTQVLPEINECSDGIVVDLTPPTAGKVWIGSKQGLEYQTSTSVLYVNWETFQDVEEFQTISHASGIQKYKLGIGTSVGGNDAIAFIDVGVVNHRALNGTSLLNGLTYYATIIATDYANRTTTQSSPPIIIDTTPPIKTDKPVTIPGRHITSDTEIEACWKNVFHDPESEIHYYEWGIGSESGYDDIMNFTRVESECGENSEFRRLDFREGHAYYISVKAYNKAGLISMATSWAYSVDFSPPLKGHVFDIQPNGSNRLDIDFQTDLSRLLVFWEGFFDQHSAIKEYIVSIGTCQECGDVIVQQSVGMTNVLGVDYVHFGPGITYYTTVMACNTAEYCTIATSDGVIMDNSPPNIGVISDGKAIEDIEYQSIRNFIDVRWFGFNDPQSGLAYYVWWAGTSPGGKEIMSERKIHVTETATALNLTPVMPVGQRIYITVRAVNRAGLFRDATSNGFIIDDTQPFMVRGPVFSKDIGIDGKTQFYRTFIKVEWDVNDKESFIEKQYVSIRSHIGGDFDLPSEEVNGIARDFVLSGLNLHDGVTYFVTVISCNGAKICTQSTSPGILIDTTPPNRGMFAIKTDHAAELHRHVEGLMTWSKYAVNLAWLGFADIHSDVTHYFINIGSKYMGADLNAEPGVPQKVNHSIKGEDRDEGKVQEYRVKTVKLGGEIQHLFVSMWAVNKAGLSSALIHSQFLEVPGGTLFLVRRCSATTCEGHCVCAPQDQVCHVNGSLCNDISKHNTNTLLQVLDVMEGDVDIGYTPSDTLLHGRWKIVHRQGHPPLWYQWSAGLTDKDTPTGIFHKELELVWHDAGQNNYVIFSTKTGLKLHEGLRYSIFVKVWYSEDTFAIFKSDGVTIVTEKPSVTNILGSSVTERMMDSAFRDQDFIIESVSFMVDWKNKFIDAEECIKTFHVYISTCPGGHDIWDNDHGLSNTETSFRVRRIALAPDVQYYSNVIAYGFSGIHNTESSDGFKTDNNQPVVGVVYDGIGLHDLEYQNTSDVVSARWHGFSDTGSGIVQYYWCVGLTPESSNEPSNTECSIRHWENVGMHTTVSRKVFVNISNGDVLYSKVYAVDNVNTKSKVAVSNGVTVDKTSPQPQYLFHSGENIAINPSFEDSIKSLPINKINKTNICSLEPDFYPGMWNLTAGSCAAVVFSARNMARNGGSFLFIKGSVFQLVDNLIVGELYRINFYTSHLLISASRLYNKEGFFSIGNIKHVFMLYTKAYRHDEHGKSETRELVSWHRHTFYFIAKSVSAVLAIGSVDEKTGLFIDDLSLEMVERDHADQQNGLHVNAHVVYLHEWGSIHGSWSFVEDVSAIKEYKWAIGYTKGGTQIQGFKSAGLNYFAYNANVTLVHNTSVHVTAVASNVAGLQGISYSEPILVDLTPPDIVHVFDGDLSNEDKEAWTDNEISVNFNTNDKESGIEYCEWAIGYQPQGIELQSFIRLAEHQEKAYQEFDYSLLENRTIFSSIRCHNKAGLSSTKSSNGVKISNRPPSTKHATVEAMPLSVTEYAGRGHYQSVANNLRLMWSGFEDFVGIEQYRVLFQGNNQRFEEKMSFAIGQDVLSTNIVHMNMREGINNITVQAIGKLLIESDTVPYNITLSTEKPWKDPNRRLSVLWRAGKKEFTVSWDNIFPSPHPLYYEVSAGTVEGGSDILLWQETTSTNTTFTLPASVTSWSGIHVHVFVKAITVGGVCNEIKGYIKLPK